MVNDNHRGGPRQASIPFAIWEALFNPWSVTKPLALIYYENLLPGTQLANRLQDLGYRVHTVLEVERLVGEAEKEKPLVAVIELAARHTQICEVITLLKQNEATGHVPILAFTALKSDRLVPAARSAGASLVASDAAMLSQLPQLLEQILELD